MCKCAKRRESGGEKERTMSESLVVDFKNKEIILPVSFLQIVYMYVHFHEVFVCVCACAWMVW